jgi:2-oxoglutarate ferredoxin oxidoreductase subunit alpha
MASQMHRKRLNKMASLKAEIAPPEQKEVASADTILVGWGTTRDAILESLELLGKREIKAGMIHFTELWPLPDFSFPSGKRYIGVEANSTGQLEWHLKAQYGLVMEERIHRSDGLPLTAQSILRKVVKDERQPV